MGMARGETIDGEEMKVTGHIWETEAGIGTLLVPQVCVPEVNPQCPRKRHTYCPASENPVFSQKDRAQRQENPWGCELEEEARLVYSDNERSYLKQGGRRR